MEKCVSLGDLTSTTWASGDLNECEQWSSRHGIGHRKTGVSKWAQAIDGCGDHECEGTIVDHFGAT